MLDWPDIGIFEKIQVLPHFALEVASEPRLVQISQKTKDNFSGTWGNNLGLRKVGLKTKPAENSINVLDHIRSLISVEVISSS